MIPITYFTIYSLKAMKAKTYHIVRMNIPNDTENKRTQSKNARLRSENWAWVKICLWMTFCLFLAMFGPDLLKFLK